MRFMTFIIIGCIVTGAQASSVLFENFEPANGVTIGTLDGQNGWSVDSGSGNVQTNEVPFGGDAQALEIANGSVSKEILTDGTTLWLHFEARISAAPSSDPVVDPAGTLAVFYVNTSQNLVVLSNGVPTELTAQMPVDTWTRFDVYCDSSAGVWDLAMNGSSVASGLPTASTNSVEQVVFSSQSTSSTYLDSLDIADTEQVGEVPDTDIDGIPDWWEQKYFGGPTDCLAGTTSGNGDLTYKDTYIAAVDPFAYDPILIGLEGGEVVWTPKQSRLHDVEWAPSLHSNFVAIASDVAWPVDSFVDTTHTNSLAGFYRVKIHL